MKAIILNENALRILLHDQDFRKYVIRHAFLLLIAAFVCSVPILVVMTSVSYSPVFRTYSALRWVYIGIQINSLANPTLYFYRNKRYRKALLQLIGLEKIQEIDRIDLKGR